MSDWEFGSDKEMHDAVHGTRKQPMTATRMGEYIGGIVGLLLAVALVLWHFFGMDWPRANPVGLVIGYLSTCAAAMFAGAQVGKQ